MVKLVSEKNITRLNQTGLDGLQSISVERKFGRPEDYIEVNILDLNNTLLHQIEDYKEYDTGDNKGGLTDEINLDPLKILNEYGYTTGRYKLHINIQKRKIFNITKGVFNIKEVSATRTELKLSTYENNLDLDEKSKNFIQTVRHSNYFRDFTLNFGRNINLSAINIDIDKSDSNQYLILVKLLKPLPNNISIGDSLTIVEDIIDPVEITYDLGTLPPVVTTEPIKGPNFKINTRLNSKVPLKFKSYNDILSTNLTSSYQRLISKLDGYEIPEIDYSYIPPIDSASLDFKTITPTHFENFVHFGSAVELLNNFKYKIELIEFYDSQLNDLKEITGDTSHSVVVTDSSASIQTKKEDLIQGFNGYEQFLYFESGTYAWPKTNSVEPFFLAHSTSSQVETWLGSANSRAENYGGQLNSASIFDSQNPNSLFKLVPTFIGDKDENRPLELFCSMIGQHFDPIWTHIKEFTQIRDNSHTLGISKNLVYYALKDLGIEAFDQFENDDLIGYIFGETLSPQDTSTVVTATSEVMSKEDISKEIWKRLYHNAPYLLKTKGTERGLRALINCYGIPETVIDIKEFGSSDPNRDEFKLYTYPKFTQVVNGNSLVGDRRGFIIETEWSSSLTNNLINAITASGNTTSSKTVEFRIKPYTGSRLDSHLFSLSNHTGSANAISSSDIHLLLHPYTGSDDFYITNDRYDYGKLVLQQFTSSIASSSYFPVYNGNFWDIFLGTEGLSGSNSTCSFGAYQSNHLREILHYTASTVLTEKTTAQSFGNPYYSGGSYTGGARAGFFGGIRDIITDGEITQSFYTNNKTGSFHLGYNGSVSEFRYYFGELLNNTTLKQHALEPLMYGGNSISSSFDHLVLRYPLSFELDLDHGSVSQLPSQSALWNTTPTPAGLVSPPSNLEGPITGGAILSSSLNVNQTSSGAAPSSSNDLGVSENFPTVSYSGQPFGSGSVPLGSAGAPIFTVGGTPTLQSHHPNVDKEYLDGFTYFTSDDIELLVETHHLPTPNTIGKSPVNKKVYIDSGSTDDDILSPDILSQLPTPTRQVPDFSNIGIYLSPQNEITEDIIYTLGTFSLDQFLGDPREGKLETYTSFKPLVDQYFKKLTLQNVTNQRYDIKDFTRWVQFLDHTLFELLKSFTPQKSIDKTGILIEPHILERTKFKRHNPILTEGGVRGATTAVKLSSSLYDSTIQDTTASFSKNNNYSQLDNTTGSVVLSHYNFIGTGSEGKPLQAGYDTTLDVAKALSGSNIWEQGPIVPNSTGSGVKQRNSSGSNELRTHVLTPYGNYLNQKVSKKLIKKGTMSHTDSGLGPNLANAIAESPGAGGTIVATTSTEVVITPSTGTDTMDIVQFPDGHTGKKYFFSAEIENYTSTGNLNIGFHLFGGINAGSGNPLRKSNGRVFGTFISNGNDIRVVGYANTGGTITDIQIREMHPTASVEFDDSLIEMETWKRSRYKGSQLTAAKINEYTVGDITYGLNPVLKNNSTALYFGKTIIGADGTEDPSLVTIKKHSYIDIEKIIIIDKYKDTIKTINLAAEDFNGINGYIAKDFKDGSSFKIKILDDKIKHKLLDDYKAKFNQGYLYKVVEYLGGDRGTGDGTGEGILVGNITSQSSDLSARANYWDGTSTTQNVFVYGSTGGSMSSTNLKLYKNKLTNEIWPNDHTHGFINFSTESVNYVNYSYTNVSSFYNSMLIPVASESQYRLFGTFNYGQPLMVADYTTGSNAGIKSISTAEFDLDRYVVTSSNAGTGTSIHTLVHASSTVGGFGRPILRPHSLIIPIMEGPHNIIMDKKPNAGITWPVADGSVYGGHIATSNTEVKVTSYFGEDDNAFDPIYQISYLEEKNVIITDLNKKEELKNDAGSKGYILMPGNLDKDIEDNLDYFLEKAGLFDGKVSDRVPNRKE